MYQVISLARTLAPQLAWRQPSLTMQSSNGVTAIQRSFRVLLRIVVAGFVLHSITMQAGTITQTQSMGLVVGVPVPPPTNLTFNKFDTRLGVLTEVKYTYSLGFSYWFTVSPPTGSGSVSIDETFSVADNSGSGFNISHAGQTGMVSFPTESGSYFIQAGAGGPGGPYFPPIAAYQASGTETFDDTVTFDEMTFTLPPGYTATPSYEDRTLTVTLTYTFTPYTNFYDIQSSFYARFVPPDPGAEDVELSPFKRWEQFWGERLYPSGDFAIAAQAYQDYLRVPQPGTTHASADAVTANWSALGPDDDPGNGLARIVAIALDPRFGTGGTGDATIYACSNRGGVWKTTTGGTSWSEMNDGLPLLNVSSIAVDPNNPDTIYIGASCPPHEATVLIEECVSQGIYKSVDGGLHWAATPASGPPPPFAGKFQHISAILVDPNNPNKVFAAVSGGTPTSSGPDDSGGIYMSTNATGMCTWTRVQSGYFRTILFQPGSTTTLYAAGDDIWKSVNGGTIWSSMTGFGTGLDFGTSPFFSGAAIQNINLAVSATTNPLRLYAAIHPTTTSTSSFYVYSFDGGTWSPKGAPSFYPGLSNHPPPNLDSIAVSPTNADIVLLGGPEAFRSTDGGNSWTEIYSYGQNPPHSDLRAFMFNPVDSSKVFVGTDGGVSKTDNILASSVNWMEIDHGIEAALMYNLSSSATHPYLIRTGHMDTGCNLYNGSQWTTSGFCGDGFEQLIDWSDPTIMYATTYPPNGLLFRSTDQGVNFCVPNIPYNTSGALWGAALVMDPVTYTTLYQGRHDVFRTLDVSCDSDWLAKSDFHGDFGTGTDQAIKALAVAPSDPNYIYTSLVAFHSPDYPRLFRTTTGGPQGYWADVTPPPPSSGVNNWITGIAIDPSNPKRLAISFSGYDSRRVMVSTNAGAPGSWMDYSEELPPMPCNHIVWRKGTDQLFVATDVGVYVRNGSMPSWLPFKTNLPNVGVQWLEINDLAQKIRAATYGRGLWESDLPSAPSTECDLTKGKVVFVSDRVPPQQLFVQHVSNFGAPPVQVTNSLFTIRYPRHPTWSPDGRYIAYIDVDFIVSNNGSDKVDTLVIIDEAGVRHFSLHALDFDGGPRNLGYPEWSPNGHEIVVTTWGNDYRQSSLQKVILGPPYFSNAGISTLVPYGPQSWAAGPVDADFSPDGQFVYYGAGWSGSQTTLWKIDASGSNNPTQLYGGPACNIQGPIRRGFALSVSPNGMRIIYNSELYLDPAVQGYMDEELLQLDLCGVGGTSGVITQLTQQPGNQYGVFAKNGSGQYVGQSNTTSPGNRDIFLCKPNATWSGSGPCGFPTCTKLNICDPNNMYDDFAPSWWIDFDPTVVSVEHHGDGQPPALGIPMPLAGIPGVECRQGGPTSDYTLQATFSSNVAVTGNPQAQVTSGTGCVGIAGVCSGQVSISGNVVTIPLTNIANAQTISVQLNQVNGTDNVTIPMSILVGDINGNGTVSAGDVAQTKGRMGQPVDATNFRSDVNGDGAINGADAAIIKRNVGSGLP